MKIIFKSAAEAEFLQAIAWYEAQNPGLGREFAIEVYSGLVAAGRDPDRFRKIRGKARMIRLKRFHAYGICFVAENEILSVLAVFHAARDPNVLHKRL